MYHLFPIFIRLYKHVQYTWLHTITLCLCGAGGALCTVTRPETLLSTNPLIIIWVSDVSMLTTILSPRSHQYISVNHDNRKLPHRLRSSSGDKPHHIHYTCVCVCCCRFQSLKNMIQFSCSVERRSFLAVLSRNPPHLISKHLGVGQVSCLQPLLKCFRSFSTRCPIVNNTLTQRRLWLQQLTLSTRITWKSPNEYTDFLDFYFPQSGWIPEADVHVCTKVEKEICK